MDPDLSPLQAVQEWAAEGNPPGQRVAYIMCSAAAAADCSLAEARQVLLPLLAQLIFDDHPDVKQATAEVLGPLGECWGGLRRAWEHGRQDRAARRRPRCKSLQGGCGAAPGSEVAAAAA